MILSGQGKQACAVSDGGEGVHPTPSPLAASTATAGTSVSGGMYGSGRTGGRADGRAVGRAERSSAGAAAGRRRQTTLWQKTFLWQNIR